MVACMFQVKRFYREADSVSLSHTGGFRVGGGVHDSYTFQCGLVGSITSPALAMDLA